MTTRLRRLAGALSLVTLLSISLALPAAAATPADPTRQIALGVSMLPSTDMGLLDQFTADTGRAPATWSIWSSWGSVWTKAFPTSLVQSLHGRGVTPMVFWEPSNPNDKYDGGYTYRKILSGKFDAYIRNWAQAAKAEGGPILLRFAHEMNGSWFPWSTSRFDNTPKRFRLAWRHVWNIFKGPGGVGATNVRFLWSPNQPCPTCSTIASVFPGDAYFDYAGFSSFNWSTPKAWKSMIKTFTPAMEALSAVTAKPIIVTETASSYSGGDKAAWITAGYPAIYAKWPQIAGVIYFNINTLNIDGLPQQRDWRLTTPNDAPLLAYKAVLADVRFQGSIN